MTRAAAPPDAPSAGDSLPRVDVTRRLQELETLNAIGEVLNREPSFLAALQQSLERLVDLVGVSTGWVFLATLEHGDPHYSGFRLAASTGVPPALAAAGCQALRAGACECMGMFRRAELDAGTNVVTCSRIQGADGDCGGLVFHASVPLLGQDSPVGILNLASPGTARFDAETLALLTAVGRQLGIAYERARLLAQRQCEAERVAALEERSRVARDIHDSVTQLLFGAHLALRVATSDDPAAAGGTAGDAVRRAAGLVESGLDELRGLVELLRAGDLEQGLYPALVRLRQRMSGAVAVHLDGEELDLPPPTAEELYRIVQEAVHNALRHAHATTLWIRLRGDDDRLHLVVDDDGVGFPDALVRGVGLDSIADRTAAVRGRLHLEARPGGGARVRVEAPWPRGS